MGEVIQFPTPNQTIDSLEGSSETPEEGEERPSRYDVACDQAEMITRVLYGQLMINRDVYQSTKSDNHKLGIRHLAGILEGATENGVKLKPAYYSAIKDLFLDKYLEWLKQFKT